MRTGLARSTVVGKPKRFVWLTQLIQTMCLLRDLSVAIDEVLDRCRWIPQIISATLHYIKHLIDQPIRQRRRRLLDTTEGILPQCLDLRKEVITLSLD